METKRRRKVPWDRKRRDYSACWRDVKGDRPHHRPIEYGGPLARLVAHFKTAKFLAKALGVSRRTIHFWAHGTPPTRRTGTRLVLVALAAGMTEDEIRPILEGRGSIDVESWNLEDSHGGPETGA